MTNNNLHGKQPSTLSLHHSDRIELMNLHATPSQMPRLSVSSVEWTCYLIILDEPDSTCFPMVPYAERLFNTITAWIAMSKLTTVRSGQHSGRFHNIDETSLLRSIAKMFVVSLTCQTFWGKRFKQQWRRLKKTDDFSFRALPLHSRRAEQAPSTHQFASAVQCVAFLKNTHTVLAITRSFTYALRVLCKELRLRLAARRTYTVICRNHRCMTRTCALRRYQQRTRQQRHCSNTGIKAGDECHVARTQHSILLSTESVVEDTAPTDKNID